MLEFCDKIEVKELMERLRRKIDQKLLDWKTEKSHLPLIIKGARQIGKTDAVEFFAKGNYKNFIEINLCIKKEGLVFPFFCQNHDYYKLLLCI